ncbi:ATP-binding cassette domain-containing protein [Aliihoeflea sp. 2WW]|uniref:ABC transporter ATP-binding protein n=1 Tax=Aliihoeflea sp. 2WW TaxID=1381123 RepID=UPI00046501E7|nr:ATP-binding cassette domain-containing protein [Aliihoeflea sp. 2WW]
MAKIEMHDVNVSYFMRRTASAGKKFERDAVGAPIIVGQAYLEIAALRNINLAISEGDRVGLIGSNGSGKSTLLKLCAGALSAQSGSVLIEGAVSPQFALAAGLKQDLSGRLNAELKCLYLGVPQRSIAKYVEDVKLLSGLGGYFELPMRSYSAGMRSRLVMSLLGLVRGEILIMDEWVNAADPRLSEAIEGIQSRLLQRSKILVLASHSERVLKSWVDRLIWLEQGEIVADGSIADVYAQYKSWLKTHQ